MSQLQPYKILWWTIPFSLGLMLLGAAATTDLQLHDTYLVIATFDIAFISSVLLGVLGGIYWLFRKYRIMRILSLSHSILTVITILGIGLIAITQALFKEEYFELFRQLNTVFMNLIGLLIVMLLVMIIIIVVGLVRGQNDEFSDSI